MTNPKCKLVVVPEGWVVVPEYPTPEMCGTLLANWPNSDLGIPETISEAIKAGPPLPDTPPVLRWDGKKLFHLTGVIASIKKKTGEENWTYFRWKTVENTGLCATEQEARRAAEKALGFPDGLIIPVLD